LDGTVRPDDWRDEAVRRIEHAETHTTLTADHFTADNDEI
jgi:hypothetical protein